MKREIFTENAPEPIGPYSQAIFTTGTSIFISGQIPINPKTGKVEGKDIKEQTKQVMENIIAILDKENLSLDNIIKCDVYLKNIKDFDKFNKVYGKYFEDYIPPARVVVEVNNLPKNSLIEISAIAAVY